MLRTPDDRINRHAPSGSTKAPLLHTRDTTLLLAGVATPRANGRLDKSTIILSRAVNSCELVSLMLQTGDMRRAAAACIHHHHTISGRATMLAPCQTSEPKATACTTPHFANSKYLTVAAAAVIKVSQCLPSTPATACGSVCKHTAGYSARQQLAGNVHASA